MGSDYLFRFQATGPNRNGDSFTPEAVDQLADQLKDIPVVTLDHVAVGRVKEVERTAEGVRATVCLDKPPFIGEAPFPWDQIKHHE